MEHIKITDHFEALTESLKRYIGLRLEVVKCVLTEALARVAGMMLRIFVFSLLAFLVLLFFSLAFVDWFGEAFGHGYIGALIVGAFYLVVGVILYLMRERLFLNPFISAYSKIFFEAENDEKK